MKQVRTGLRPRLAASLGAAWMLGASACGESDRTDVIETPDPGSPSANAGGAATGGSAGAPAEPDCFENPSTHFELINACTTAVRVEKTPELTLLPADGTLPPL